MAIILSIIATAVCSAADSYFVRGIVRDSLTLEPLPRASVRVDGYALATVADDNGIFEMSVPTAAKALLVTCVGYDKGLVPLKRSVLNTYAVYLQPSTTSLNEVVATRSHYSKHNNPAVEFARRLRDAAPLTDPERHDYYNYDVYQRLTLGINNFTAEDYSNLCERMPFLTEHVDTSEVSGKPYLSLIVKEKTSERHYRRNPQSRREIITGSRSAGIDDIVDPASMTIFMEDVMREIDLTDESITLFQNRFVSPLSRIAPDFYKFYLTDTVDIGGERCIMLSFYPHNHATFGFMGHVYVVEGDSTMPVKRVEMHVPREINLNFVHSLTLSQDFERAVDGTCLKIRDDLTAELSLTGGSGPGMYVSRRSAMSHHDFGPADERIFATSAPVVTAEGAESRDERYWELARPGVVAKGERTVASLIKQLRQQPVYYWGEKIIKILFTGYVATGNPSKVDIGPVNAMLSFNSTEGVRLRFGGMTTAELSKRWFSRFYVAYGIKDHKWKYGVELEYSFIDKTYHSREFPVKSLRLTSSYDIERPGQHYLYTSPDNIVLSLKRAADNRVLYRRLNRLEYTLETAVNFSVNASVSNISRQSTPTLELIDGYGTRLSHVDETLLQITLRYAPGEKFYQTRTYRLPVNLDAPAVTLRHTIGPRRLFGARYNVNVTELDIAKRWWLSAFGFIDTYLSGGHVWGSTSFLNLLMPDVNLSYIIEPRSFMLLNPMEFISSTYGAFDFTYWANGALLNYIPLVKRLKLREVFGFKAMWGRLDDSCNPSLHPELLQFPLGSGTSRLTHGPYMEASVGLENIFKVLRIDYVLRLNYRHMPYKIDRSGVRIAVKISF